MSNSQRKKPRTKADYEKLPKKPRRAANTRIRDPRGEKDWPLWIMAARDIGMGATVKAAAAAIGRTERTLYNWMKHEAWESAYREAEELCLRKLDQEAMQAISHNLQRKNGGLGLEYLKLRLKQLQPAQKHEVTGANGGPIATEQRVLVYMPHNNREEAPVNRLAALPLNGNGTNGNGKHHGGG